MEGRKLYGLVTRKTVGIDVAIAVDAHANHITQFWL
jgi:hypothetical protein